MALGRNPREPYPQPALAPPVISIILAVDMSRISHSTILDTHETYELQRGSSLKNKQWRGSPRIEFSQ